MLKYTGKGIGAFLPGIPARDLSDDEVAALGGEKELIATGLYEKLEQKPRRAVEEPPEEGEA